MRKKHISIDSIPAILWGDDAENLFIAVHGSMSHKEDKTISILAEEATNSGFQVLSFDLPEHGARTDGEISFTIKSCIDELNTISDFAETISSNIHLFGCSIGSFVSIAAFQSKPPKKSLFLSPVLDMKEILTNIMNSFSISEHTLEKEQVIETPIGITLYWEDYSYIMANPITRWDSPTSILYGANDDVCHLSTVEAFVNTFSCKLDVLQNGEHYFHKEDHLLYYREWLKRSLS